MLHDTSGQSPQSLMTDLGSTEQPFAVLSELTLALTKVVSWQASKPFRLT